MWITAREQNTSGWYEIKVKPDSNLRHIVGWCKEYTSPHGVFIDCDGPGFYAPIRMRFEKQEDAMMFLMSWTDDAN